MDSATNCPTCQRPGARVDRITLKALLTPEGLRRGIPPQPRLCATADCPVVYFDVDRTVTFAESEVIVPVYAKDPDEPDMPVCYCFGLNVGSMRDDRAQELRAIVARELKAGHCACEVKNPKGVCCLGDLARIECSEQSQAALSCCTTV